jgi:hypothetical protein
MLQRKRVVSKVRRVGHALKKVVSQCRTAHCTTIGTAVSITRGAGKHIDTTAVVLWYTLVVYYMAYEGISE